ncbi:coagulation factor IX-like protein [Pitangus sulphuratus]|nr:coagulation factor IX-like protein [Pitangus sulphuratus]
MPLRCLQHQLFSFGLPVFMRKDKAHEVLRVHKRANHFLEEIRMGNLERECNEEKCSFEEAKEIFHSQEKTMEFWFNYKERAECWYKNGGCWQYCRDSSASQVECSCTRDYTLHEDGRSCVQAAPFPCGLIKARQEQRRGPKRLPRGQWEHGDVSQLKRSMEGTAGQMELEHGDVGEKETVKETFGHAGQKEVAGDASSWNETGVGSVSQKPLWDSVAGQELDGPEHHTAVEGTARPGRGPAVWGDFDKYQREVKEQKIAVERSWTHPHYDSNDYNGDIALLYLSSAVVFNEYAIPICLPSPGLAALLSEEGRPGVVSGWGATHARGSTLRFLMKVRLPLVSLERCQRAMDRLVTDNMLCAGHGTAAADACKGDSGGPFTASHHNTWFLLGIVSWGEGCAQQGKYGVYTRVANYIPWIKEVVESVADSENFSINFS